MVSVLVVDDQPSVLAGIAKGVHFSELGVDEVFYASGAQEALEICRRHPVDITFTDVEMPGENGLELNRKLQAEFPQMLRILLTSHAEFSYAQESTRTGCFDYILQPAPYDEIEECLKRALQELMRLRKNAQLARYGQLLQTSETDLMDHVVLNLFSRSQTDVEESLSFLEQTGYRLTQDQAVQIILIDAKSYRRSAQQLYPEKTMHQAIFDSLKKAGIIYPVMALTMVSPLREFMAILFSAVGEYKEPAHELFQLFYEKLGEAVPQESFSCYIGMPTILKEMREARRRLANATARENVEDKTGVFFEKGEQAEGFSLNLTESVGRWTRLLAGGQRGILEREIDSVIRSTIEKSSAKHRSLSELHQQLTHIFLSYFYENNVDISELFDGSYSYMDYMDSFQHTGTLKNAISYMLDKAEKLQKKDLPKSDVERAKSFIAENLAEAITVREVADHVGLSPEYFTKMFKQETGQNIKEYILQTTIEAAKDMMAHSDLSVSLVAMELGWSNFSHFTQVFKKIENMTPSEYKNSLQKK